MKTKNRWLILIAAIIMNLCVGSAYAYSVFKAPLHELFGWSNPQISLAYTINLGLVPVAMIFAGRVQDKKGPKIVTITGGLIFGIGIYLAGSITSLTMLYLTYGLLGGLGIGTVYACTVGNTMKWFPDRKGFAGGLVAVGFGMGSVVFGPLAAKLIPQYGVLNTFHIFGIVFAIGIIVASMVTSAPEPGWKPEGWNPPVSANVASGGSDDLTPAEMIRTKTFYIIWGMYMIGCVGGLMVIGELMGIAKEMQLVPQIVAVGTMVIFLGLSNSGGRFLWGAISDKIGRYNTLTLMFIVTATSLLILNFIRVPALIFVAIAGIVMSFGGYLGLMPSVAVDNFGAKHIGINYGILFTAFGIAAVIGPVLAARLKEASGGSYSTAFMTVVVMNIVGILLVRVIKSNIKKAKA